MNKSIMPSNKEIAAEIIRIADLCYDGESGPGLRNFNTHRPPGWPTGVTISRHVRPPGRKVANWAATVKWLTGLAVPDKPLPTDVYIPGREELATAIFRIADKYYAGKFAPGQDIWKRHKPEGWPIGRTLAKHYRVKGYAPTWAATVRDLTGLQIAPNGIAYQQITEEPAPRLPRRDDEQFEDWPSANHVCRAYTNLKTGAEHYILR